MRNPIGGRRNSSINYLAKASEINFVDQDIYEAQNMTIKTLGGNESDDFELPFDRVLHKNLSKASQVKITINETKSTDELEPKHNPTAPKSPTKIGASVSQDRQNGTLSPHYHKRIQEDS